MILIQPGTYLQESDGSPIIQALLGAGLSYDEITKVLSVDQNITDGVISGGIVTWLHDYVYNVSLCVYAIGGVVYNSPSTDITLDPADPTDDRIDIFVVTTSSTAIAITGTPSTPPVEPDYDPATQLQVAFATVDAGTTEPTIVQQWIYLNNTEWTTFASNVAINPNSTNNPYQGAKDVEGTSVPNNAYITFTDPSLPINIGLYQNLSFLIRNKINWGTTRKWIIRWYNGSVAIGNPVTFGSGTYGFIASLVGSYQPITIPLSDFGSISTATNLRITQSSNSGTGWYLDNIQIQGQQGGVQTITLTGDVTGTGTSTIPTTLATVNSNVGTFGSASSVAVVTENAKGLTTAASSVAIQIAESQVTNLVSDLAAKLSAALTNTHIFVGNGSNIATDVAMSGDATLSNLGALTLATILSVLTKGSASKTVTLTTDAKGRITALSDQDILIAESQVTNLVTDLAAKLSTTLTSGHILVGNVSNVATDVAMSGDVTISNTGVTTLNASFTNNPLMVQVFS